MIKLSNLDALQFFSPEVEAIFSNPENKFPIAAGHLLIVGVEKIRKEFAEVPKSHDKIVREFGTVDPKTQQISYDTAEKQLECQKALTELMEVKREINVRQVKVTDSFPALTAKDIKMLSPLLIFEE